MRKIIPCVALCSILFTPYVYADYEAGLTAYQNKDYATVLKEWKPMAERGDARAQFSLGVMYDTGAGVSKDNKEAARWFRLAADQGNADAKEMLNLGYAERATTASSNSRPESGVGREEYELGQTEYQNKNYRDAFNHYRKAAEAGLVDAQTMVGYLYLNGQGEWGVTGDFANKEALKWFQLAANQGSASAQNLLGVMYVNGWLYYRAEPHDDKKEAARWFQLAASQGFAEAQFNLGAMYESGQGVPKDDREATKWYRLAANNGNENAKLKFTGQQNQVQFDALRRLADKDFPASVLNFTTTRNETGDASTVWYPVSGSQCIYKKASLENGILDKSAATIDLKKIHAQSINVSINASYLLALPIYMVAVSDSSGIVLNGAIVGSTDQSFLQKVRRGWQKIYNGSCSGIADRF